MMKYLNKLIIPALAVLLLTLRANAQSEKFTGSWKINTEKTNAPGVDVSSFSPLIKIGKDDKAITIYRIKTGQDEKNTYSETLKLDGSPSESVTPSKLKRSSVFKWSADQKSFTEDYVSKDNMGNIIQVVKQTWTLSADRKTLLIKQDFKQDEHVFVSDLVYEKQ